MLSNFFVFFFVFFWIAPKNTQVHSIRGEGGEPPNIQHTRNSMHVLMFSATPDFQKSQNKLGNSIQAKNLYVYVYVCMHAEVAWTGQGHPISDRLEIICI